MYAITGIKIVQAMQPLNRSIVCELSIIAIINVIIYMPARMTAHIIARICFIFFISFSDNQFVLIYVNIGIIITYYKVIHFNQTGFFQ